MIGAARPCSRAPATGRAPTGASLVVALLLAGGCAEGAPLALTAVHDGAGIAVTATAPLVEVEVIDAAGLPVVRDRAPAPSAALTLAVALTPGRYTIRARDVSGARAEAALTQRAPAPLAVDVQPRIGAEWVTGSGEVAVPVIAGGSAEVAIGLTRGPDGPAEVRLGEETVALPVVGARTVRHLRVADAPVAVAVGDARFTLVPAPVSVGALAADVSVAADAFPAEADGAADPGRPAGRVDLPSPAWERLVRAVGLGGRRHDDRAPWAYWSVTLRNAGDAPADLEVALAVEGADGATAEAFRPRLRAGDGDTGTVAVLVRVPAHGETRAALPVFVDTPRVEAGAYTVALTVTPLGGDTPIHRLSRPLHVRRGDPVAGFGFGGALLAAAGGGVLLTARLRRWLDAAATSELMTVALFGSASFLVGTAADLVAMGIGAVLGPLSSLLTGLLSDLGRCVLLATLLTLLPRPGTLALAALVGWFLRGFATGAFAPVDILFTGMAIGVGEAAAWLAGLTRGGAWRDDPPTRRWLRLAAGLAGASVCTTLAGFWVHTVLYRLFYAPWYVAIQVLVPGFLYPIVACRIAVDVAASLRRVQA